MAKTRGRGEIRLALSLSVPAATGESKAIPFCLATLRDARSRDVIAPPCFMLTFPLRIVNFILRRFMVGCLFGFFIKVMIFKIEQLVKLTCFYLFKDKYCCDYRNK